MTIPPINGWTLLAHPLFLNQYEALIAATRTERAKNPSTFETSKPAKLLAAVTHLITEAIPADPTDTKYRQGNTLGTDAKHWFRAKFYQQYRLFFRYDSRAKIIIFVWFNDEDTKRAYESDTDAYKTFRKMLENGNPPNNWAELLAEAKSADPRFAQSVKAASAKSAQRQHPTAPADR